MISLRAEADYGKTGQYIARITGRHPKFTFAREFMGRKNGKRGETTQADVDEPGLYECCDIDKEGKQPHFVLVVVVNESLVKFGCDKGDAMLIGRAMNAGRPFEEIVEANEDGYKILRTKEAVKRQTTQTIETATNACWAVLQALPSREARKVLAALKNKVNPPKNEDAPPIMTP